MSLHACIALQAGPGTSIADAIEEAMETRKTLNLDRVVVTHNGIAVEIRARTTFDDAYGQWSMWADRGGPRP